MISALAMFPAVEDEMTGNSMPNHGIAGLIEGSMTILPEPGGGVSFRVLIGVGGKQAAERDLLELIISAGHIADLSRALAGHGAGSLPCHIGFSRNAVSAAA
jgi:hypothetical protein